MMHNYFSSQHFYCFADNFVKLQMVKYVNNTGETNLNQLQHAFATPKMGTEPIFVWSVCIDANANAPKITQWN